MCVVLRVVRDLYVLLGVPTAREKLASVLVRLLAVGGVLRPAALCISAATSAWRWTARSRSACCVPRDFGASSQKRRSVADEPAYRSSSSSTLDGPAAQGAHAQAPLSVAAVPHSIPLSIALALAVLGALAAERVPQLQRASGRLDVAKAPPDAHPAVARVSAGRAQPADQRRNGGELGVLERPHVARGADVGELRPRPRGGDGPRAVRRVGRRLGALGAADRQLRRQLGRPSVLPARDLNAASAGCVQVEPPPAGHLPRPRLVRLAGAEHHPAVASDDGLVEHVRWGVQQPRDRRDPLDAARAREELGAKGQLHRGVCDDVGDHEVPAVLVDRLRGARSAGQPRRRLLEQHHVDGRGPHVVEQHRHERVHEAEDVLARVDARCSMVAQVDVHDARAQRGVALDHVDRRAGVDARRVGGEERALGVGALGHAEGPLARLAHARVRDGGQRGPRRRTGPIERLAEGERRSSRGKRGRCNGWTNTQPFWRSTHPVVLIYRRRAC